MYVINKGLLMLMTTQLAMTGFELKWKDLVPLSGVVSGQDYPLS